MSVSCGSANRGALANPVALPIRGWAHAVPRPWSRRGRNYGTRDMVHLIERAAGEVATRFPGSFLGVADISGFAGGRTGGHRSHQSGRDADLLYYAMDRAGRPVAPDSAMPIYDQIGRATAARRPSRSPRIRERFFDLARNWALVRAMLTHPTVRLDRVFVAPRIERWLIAFAEATDEPRWLVRRAAAILTQPTRDMGHDDHMHIRIKCGRREAASGNCSDDLAPHRRAGAWRTRVMCPRVATR